MHYLKDNQDDMRLLLKQMQGWAHELGFQQFGVSDTDLSQAELKLLRWLDNDYHGDMDWMSRHGSKRSHPSELHPDTIRVISVRMDYWPEHTEDAWDVLLDSNKAYVSRYALGRDYHKLMRQRLQKLATRIEDTIGAFGYRVFVDSAPVLEKPLAEKAGLGWIGKHTNLIHKDAGSWFFLGEIYLDLPLPIETQTSTNHCGTCQACIEACPTQAIIAPYLLDARRCISYLTIEHNGSIPISLRTMMGNRIYGCDDCQLVCPWNGFSQNSREGDFNARHKLDDSSLLSLFTWNEKQFEQRMQGSAIRRIGYEKWIRNLSIALGNALRKTREATPAINEGPAAASEEIIAALQQRIADPSALIREHVLWALEQ